MTPAPHRTGQPAGATTMTRPSPPSMHAAPPGPARPGPHCPARDGQGADIATAAFTLVADDCANGPDRRPTMTDIFGYFKDSDDEHDDASVMTAGLTVPV